MGKNAASDFIFDIDMHTVSSVVAYILIKSTYYTRCSKYLSENRQVSVKLTILSPYIQFKKGVPNIWVLKPLKPSKTISEYPVSQKEVFSEMIGISKISKLIHLPSYEVIIDEFES